MSEQPILITFASWEERFAGNVRECIAEHRPSMALMYYLDNYAERTGVNRNMLRQLCFEDGLRLEEHALNGLAAPGNWQQMRDDFSRSVARGSKVIVDITTMPRDIIWIAFWLLEYQAARVEFVYRRPHRYNQEWLSRDPQRPRLVYKLSGISELGKRTCLVIVAGYDVERSRQLINHYEPEVTLLGLQAGNHDDSDNARRMEQNRSRFAAEQSHQSFELDAYSRDQGEARILAAIEPFLGTHNIIMSSLGPKLSAVALYRIQRQHPHIGLAYASSREFNLEYSYGVGELIRGSL